MTSKAKATQLLLVLLLLVGITALYLGWGDSGDVGFSNPDPGQETVENAGPSLTGDSGKSAESQGLQVDAPAERSLVEVPKVSQIGVRGRVLDIRSRQPMADVEVLALTMWPGIERPVTRLRGLFTEGLWTDTAKPAKVLARTTTAGDGSFELLGLKPGRIFLDARSERAFVRNPGSLRLARGQVQEGVELLASPGGRIVGQVLDPEGLPASGARVSLRPGLNSFLAQLTKRQYRWLEVTTDGDGKFDMPGVPEGNGYSVTAASGLMALSEQHKVDVHVGQTVTLVFRGRQGAQVFGRAVDAEGKPVMGAQVAMLYLDVSRMLFSADGRDEPVSTDEDGRFHLDHVAPGRVAFIAASDSLAPSNIEELAVVDGGIYEDIVLTLDKGGSFSGLVVDENDRPLAGVEVGIRPQGMGMGMGMGRGGQTRGADAMKMILKIRRVRAVTGADGRFTTEGVTGSRLMLQFSKPDYITVIRSGVKADEKDLRVQLTRGVTLRGKVQLAEGKPIQRFRVEARSREVRPASGPAAKAEEEEPRPGINVRFGGGESRRGRWGRGRGGGRGPWGRGGTRRLPVGQTMEDRNMESGWEEVRSAEGTFELRGLPPGKIRVRVRADGYLDPERQEVELAVGQSSEVLTFVLEAGAIARGMVLDEAGKKPVPEATVTAYRARKESGRQGGFRLFRPNIDPEDFDFLGLSAMNGQRSVMTDSHGRFEIQGLKGGKYRFTARHPDLAKASVKEVEIAASGPTEGIEILLSGSSGIEGYVTGAGKHPLASAMVVAFGLQSGSFKSDATDAQGYYRMEGLAPGRYIVFKSRMEEGSQDLVMDLMSNMRFKTTSVRRNKFTRFDLHDETANSVRVYGYVRDGGKPVLRSMVTFLGKDRDGLLGMGIRAKPTDDEGKYELIGINPGDYLVQVSRFRRRAEQSNLTLEIPEGVRDFRFDIDLPQSYVEGTVSDSQGNPVEGVQVNLGMQKSDMQMDGLLGLIMSNGLARGRTDKEGKFSIKGVATGTYRLTASGRRAFGAARKYGEVALDDIRVDGMTPVTGLTLTLPLSGSITGVVVNADGVPVVGAELHAVSEARNRARDPRRALTSLFGIQERPVKSDAGGRFEIKNLSPGEYRVRADVKGLAPGTADDVQVLEGQETDVSIRVIKGATLKVRITNIDGTHLPIANITVLDGKGKALASKVSVLSVFRQYMKGKNKKDSSGWREIGGIPPDTYTLIIREKGQPELRVQRTIRDGEEARWDINMGEELKRHRESKKK